MARKQPRNHFNLYWDTRRRFGLYKHVKPSTNMLKGLGQLYGIDKSETWRQKGVNAINAKLEQRYAERLARKREMPKRTERVKAYLKRFTLKRQQEQVDEGIGAIAKAAIRAPIVAKQFLSRKLRRTAPGYAYRIARIKKRKLFKGVKRFAKKHPGLTIAGGVAGGIATTSAIDVGSEQFQMRIKRKTNPEYDLHLRQLAYERQNKIGRFNPEHFKPRKPKKVEEAAKPAKIKKEVTGPHTKFNAMVSIFNRQAPSLKQQMSKHPRDKHYTLRSRWKKNTGVKEDAMENDPIIETAARIYEGLFFKKPGPGEFRQAIGLATGNTAMAVKGFRKQMTSDVDGHDSMVEWAPLIAAATRIAPLAARGTAWAGKTFGTSAGRTALAKAATRETAIGMGVTSVTNKLMPPPRPRVR